MTWTHFVPRINLSIDLVYPFEWWDSVRAKQSSIMYESWNQVTFHRQVNKHHNHDTSSTWNRVICHHRNRNQSNHYNLQLIVQCILLKMYDNSITWIILNRRMFNIFQYCSHLLILYESIKYMYTIPPQSHILVC